MRVVGLFGALFVFTALAALAGDATAQGCPPNSEPAYRQDRTTYCRCVDGYVNVGGRCEPVPTTPGQPLLSEERERELGRLMSADLNARMTFVTDPRVTAYVQGLVDRLARGSTRTGVAYEVRVCDNCVVPACFIACSLPGGAIYINRGFIRSLGSEAELAGVLAHEVGHVSARHQAQNLDDRVRAVGLSALLAGPVWPLVQEAVYMKFKRDHEREADRLAVEMLYQARIKPTGLIVVFDRIRQMRPTPGVVEAIRETYLASHPSEQERIANLEPLLADPRFNTIPPGSSAEYHAVQRRLATP
jgi:predicted Zn-dependent protease